MAGRRPTLADVARAAAVSPALVSIVVRGAPGASQATRERVLAEADRLGYRPDARARLLRSGRSRLLGVTFGVDQPFHADLVEGLYEAAEAVGLDIALSATTPRRTEERALRTLLDDRCEALVLVGPVAAEEELARIAPLLPLVVLARAVHRAEVDTVRSDDVAGAALAVAHLLERGHRDLVHVDGGDAPGAADRRSAFVAGVRAAGLPVRVLPGGAGEDAGARAAAELVVGGLPTGVVAFNDRCATGVLDSFLRAGVRVPADVSVVGHDDSRLARLAHVDLTSVGQDAATLARLAVARVVARVSPGQELPVPDPGPRVVTTPRLVVRGSTGVPRAP